MKTVAEWYSQGLAADPPRVSVAAITYKHEPFIADAIEGVLMQEVDFPVELVIGEDCSPDRTREIIEEYSERYPGFIHLIAHDQNIGANANFRGTVDRCRGEYLALLDGDDFWTEPRKLRAQVTLLDQNPQYSACFHATSLVRDGEVIVERDDPRGRRAYYTLEDIPKWIYMATSSIVFCRSALPGFPPWFPQVYFGDLALKTLIAEKGDIAFIPEVLGARRLHPDSLWLGRKPKSSESAKLHIQTLEHLCRHLEASAAVPFERERHRLHYDLIHALIDEGSRREAGDTIAALGASEAALNGGARAFDTEKLRALTHYYAPPLYRLLRAIRHRRGGASDPAKHRGPR